MSNSEKRYQEMGIKSPENMRLVNQLQLQTVAHHVDFFPEVIDFKGFDNTDGYEVNHIDGQTLHELMGGDNAVFISHVIEAARQQKNLLEQFGIIIKDRNKDNFIFGKKASDKKAKLYQIDLENVYDAVRNQDFIGANENLGARYNQPIQYIDQRLTDIEIADVCDSLITIVFEHLQKKQRNQREQEIYVKLNKMLGSARLNSFQKLIELLTEIKEYLS